jgi:hypothetical protein
MKIIFKWLGSFFSSESNNSSKRLVGIVGAGFLYWTLYMSSVTDKNIAPSDALVYSVAALVAVSLGLTTVEALKGLINRDNTTDAGETNK